MAEEDTTDDTGKDDTDTGPAVDADKGGNDKGGEGRSTSDDDGAADLGDAGKRALDAMKRERNAARDEAKELRGKVKSFEDKDKSESQRLSEAADDAKTRAGKAEQGYKRLQTAMDRAPEGATLSQIKAVAKRLHGESDEELEADADELFALLAPSQSTSGKKPPAGKPKERLRGGGDPDEEPEETDPRKLAALIGRP